MLLKVLIESHQQKKIAIYSNFAASSMSTSRSVCKAIVEIHEIKGPGTKRLSSVVGILSVRGS